MLISKMDFNDVDRLSSQIEEKISNSSSIEQAAQIMMETLYEKFRESIVLIRLFVTFRKQNLPAEIQTFASDLAKTANLDLAPETFILTLMGTAGKERDWMVRTKSQGHLGIPLATADFVSAIPMMSALLEQLGFKLGWIRGEPHIVAEHMGSLAGTFYVEDAASGMDSKGRKIIAAQDFVSKYGVKTVFGVGGGYTLTDRFLTTIWFLNERIDKSRAVWFQTLANVFKLSTQDFIKDSDKIFK